MAKNRRHFWNFIKPSAFILITFFSICDATTSLSTSTPFKFIALSDIHFDPFLGCHFKKTCQTVEQLRSAPISQWDDILSKNTAQQNKRLQLGMDSNFYLLNRTLSELNKQIQLTNPAFVIHTGDFIAHGIDANYEHYFKSHQGYQAFIGKLFQYLHVKLQNAANKVPVYFVMGNNDGYRGDYVINAGGDFFKDIATDWPALTQANKENNQLLTTSGNYAIETSPNWRLIVLNTNLFYKKTTGNLKEMYAHQAIDWFARQLEKAKQQNQQVLVFYHIPYGITPSKRLMDQNAAALWNADINHRFYELANAYNHQIKGLIHGHVHRDSFMALHENHEAPLTQHLVCAISPIFGNAATFMVLEVADGLLKSKTIQIDTI